MTRLAERLVEFALDGISLVADDKFEEEPSQVIELMVAGPRIAP